MPVTSQPTPNPATLKFLVDADLVDDGSADFPDAAAAAGSPLAARLFALDGVAAVFMGRDFVAVTKAGAADWAALEAPVAAAIAAHLAAGEPALHRRPSVPPAAVAATDAGIVERIQALLDSHVRPGVALDGGNIAFRGYGEGIVYLEMQGACAGCPSSVMTLRYSVENLLRHYVPEVREVRAVLPRD